MAVYPFCCCTIPPLYYQYGALPECHVDSLYPALYFIGTNIPIGNTFIATHLVPGCMLDRLMYLLGDEDAFDGGVITNPNGLGAIGLWYTGGGTTAPVYERQNGNIQVSVVLRRRPEFDSSETCLAYSIRSLTVQGVTFSADPETGIVSITEGDATACTECIGFPGIGGNTLVTRRRFPVDEEPTCLFSYIGSVHPCYRTPDPPTPTFDGGVELDGWWIAGGFSGPTPPFPSNYTACSVTWGYFGPCQCVPINPSFSGGSSYGMAEDGNWYTTNRIWHEQGKCVSASMQTHVGVAIPGSGNLEGQATYNSWSWAESYDVTFSEELNHSLNTVENDQFGECIETIVDCATANFIDNIEDPCLQEVSDVNCNELHFFRNQATVEVTF